MFFVQTKNVAIGLTASHLGIDGGWKTSKALNHRRLAMGMLEDHLTEVNRMRERDLKIAYLEAENKHLRDQNRRLSIENKRLRDDDDGKDTGQSAARITPVRARHAKAKGPSMQTYTESHSGWTYKQGMAGDYAILDANDWPLATLNYDYRFTCNATNFFRARLLAAAPELYEYVKSSASAGCATAQALVAKIEG